MGKENKQKAFFDFRKGLFVCSEVCFYFKMN
jgi:hypothetical protein